MTTDRLYQRYFWQVPGEGDVKPVSDGQVKMAAPSFRRELFAHEEASQVDFAALDSAWTSVLEGLLIQWRAIRDQQVALALAQVRTIVESRQLENLARIGLPTGEGRDALARAMLDLALQSADEANGELVRQGLERTTGHIDAGLLSARAGAVDELLAQTLSSAIGNKALQLAGSQDGQAVAKGVSEYVNGLSETYLHDQLGGALMAAQNAGRMAVFQQAPPSQVYASEILDKATCGPCREIDGKNFDSLAEAHLAYPTGGYRDCKGGPRCRGTVIVVAARVSPASVP